VLPFLRLSLFSTVTWCVLEYFSTLFGDTLPTRPRFLHFVGLVSTINFYVFNF
jgi:hypothetical protein